MSLYNNFVGSPAAERAWSSRQYVDLRNRGFINNAEELAAMQQSDPFITAHLGTHDAYVLGMTRTADGTSWTEASLDLSTPAAAARARAALAGGNLQQLSSDPVIAARPAAIANPQQLPTATVAAPKPPPAHPWLSQTQTSRVLTAYASEAGGKPSPDLLALQAELASAPGRSMAERVDGWISSHRADAGVDKLRLAASVLFVVGQDLLKSRDDSGFGWIQAASQHFKALQ